jgi:hypothetical protein
VRRALEASENLGPTLARLADERGELATALGRIGDTILEPLASSAADLVDLINTGLTPIGKWFEENGEDISDIVDDMLPGGDTWFGWKQQREEIEFNKLAREKSAIELLVSEDFIAPPRDIGFINPERPKEPFNPVVAGIPGGFQ